MVYFHTPAGEITALTTAQYKRLTDIVAQVYQNNFDVNEVVDEELKVIYAKLLNVW
jgi:hypothetical protein